MEGMEIKFDFGRVPFEMPTQFPHGHIKVALWIWESSSEEKVELWT